MTAVSTPEVSSDIQRLFTQLLVRAVEAPSGDNSQPWRFRFDGDALLVLNTTDADETLYNFEQHGSYVAHGAVIENLSLLVLERGFMLTAELFPGEKDVTARLTLTPAPKKESPLTAVLEMRTTNRKPYRNQPLSSEDKSDIAAAAAATEGITLRLVEDTEDRALVARTVSLNEQLLMENRNLHDFLFGMIRWSRADETKKPGLFVTTMELPPPVKFLFRHVLNHWFIVRVLGVIGFPRAIRKQTGAVYGTSAAFGALIVKSESPEDFVQIGRALERLWLTATVRGVSLQPVTALPYLGQRIRAGAAGAFSKRHQDLISDAMGDLTRAFRLSEGEQIGFLFRLGYADAPSAQSAKQPPVIG